MNATPEPSLLPLNGPGPLMPTAAPLLTATATAAAGPQAASASGNPASATTVYRPYAQAATVTSEVDCSLQYQVDSPTDFLFQVHALQGMDQVVLSELMVVSPAMPFRVFADPNMGQRFTRLRAPAGVFTLRYRATVRRVVPAFDPTARLVPIADLPDNLLHNLMPTRYCESDLLGPTAYQLFGGVAPGAPQVMAVLDWIHQNIAYRVGASQPTTTANDVFKQRAGVCRDFAHLAVTFCRALNMPARLVAGYAPFDEPPPDFHAVIEVYIGDRWVLLDPTRLALPERLVRIASGRDAKDVAFSSIFGPARMLAMAPLIQLAV